jgi:hypothetical protein
VDRVKKYPENRDFSRSRHGMLFTDWILAVDPEKQGFFEA